MVTFLKHQLSNHYRLMRDGHVNQTDEKCCKNVLVQWSAFINGSSNSKVPNLFKITANDRPTCIVGKVTPTRKLANQFENKAILMAAPRGPCRNNSATINQGMEATNTTNFMRPIKWVLFKMVEIEKQK